MTYMLMLNLIFIVVYSYELLLSFDQIEIFVPADIDKYSWTCSKITYVQVEEIKLDSEILKSSLLYQVVLNNFSVIKKYRACLDVF